MLKLTYNIAFGLTSSRLMKQVQPRFMIELSIKSRKGDGRVWGVGCRVWGVEVIRLLFFSSYTNA